MNWFNSYLATLPNWISTFSQLSISTTTTRLTTLSGTSVTLSRMTEVLASVLATAEDSPTSLTTRPGFGGAASDLWGLLPTVTCVGHSLGTWWAWT